MNCCCLPPTPQYINDTYTVDVFGLIINNLDTTPEIKLMLIDECWQRFRYRPIGDYDYQYWLIILNDKIKGAWAWYSRIVDTFMSENIINLTNGKDVTSESGSSISSMDGITESENDPDTAAGSTKYVSNRGENNTNGLSSYQHDSTTSRNQGLDMDMLNKLIDGLKISNFAFVKELDPLFMNRW